MKIRDGIERERERDGGKSPEIINPTSSSWEGGRVLFISILGCESEMGSNFSESKVLSKALGKRGTLSHYEGDLWVIDGVANGKIKSCKKKIRQNGWIINGGKNGVVDNGNGFRIWVQLAKTNYKKPIVLGIIAGVCFATIHFIEGLSL